MSPVLLSLIDAPVATISLAQGPDFSYDPVQGPIKTGWVAADNALLVRDIDGDGLITHGAELFGDQTLLRSTSKAVDGYHALRDLDDNQDQRLDPADQAFAELMLWQDFDVDGVTDSGELSSLDDHQIVSLDLNAQASDRVDQGNAVALVSSYTLADGTTREMADVWFAIATDAVDQPESSLDTFLSTGQTRSDSTAPESVEADHGSPTTSQEVLDFAASQTVDDLSELLLRPEFQRV